MTSTTAATTFTTTRGNRRATPSVWTAPENVHAVLDRADDIPDGHITLSVYDSFGNEHVAARASVSNVTDPMAWLLSSIDTTLRVHGDECRHLRVRVWERSGVGAMGAKFKAPDPASLVVPAGGASRSGGGSMSASRPAPRTEIRRADRPATRVPDRAVPRHVVTAPTDWSEALRRDLAQWRVRCEAATARATRAEAAVADLKRRLLAREAAIASLNQRCAELTEEREELNDQIETLSQLSLELQEAWGR